MPFSIKHSLPSWMLLSVGFILLLVLIAHHDPDLLVNRLRRMDTAWVWLSILCLSLATLLGAINVYLLIEPKQGLAFIPFLRVYWLSWAIGLVVPGQIGDLATISLALKKRGMDFSAILGRSFLDKLISLCIMSCIALYAIAILFKHVAWTWNWRLLEVASFGFITCTLFFLWRWNWLETVFHTGRNGWLGTIDRAARELAFAIKQIPLRIALNWIITSIKVCLIGLAYWAMFGSLGYDAIPIPETIAYATLAGLAAYLPISLNGVGTVEAAGIPLFGQLGIPSTEVLAAYLCLRLIVLGLAWAPAFVWVIIAPRLTPVKPEHEQRLL